MNQTPKKTYRAVLYRKIDEAALGIPIVEEVRVEPFEAATRTEARQHVKQLNAQRTEPATRWDLRDPEPKA